MLIAAFATGRKRTGWATLRVFLVCVVAYVAALEAYQAIAVPFQVFNVNESLYDGDWSIGVSSVRRVPHDLDEDYEIDLRLTSRGGKTVSGDPRLEVYLTQEDGTRYDGGPISGMPPITAPVAPGKFVITTYKFVLPTNLNRVRLVVAYRGFHLGKLIIGRTPFDGRTVTQITD